MSVRGACCGPSESPATLHRWTRQGLTSFRWVVDTRISHVLDRRVYIYHFYGLLCGLINECSLVMPRIVLVPFGVILMRAEAFDFFDNVPLGSVAALPVHVDDRRLGWVDHCDVQACAWSCLARWVCFCCVFEMWKSRYFFRTGRRFCDCVQNVRASYWLMTQIGCGLTVPIVGIVISL